MSHLPMSRQEMDQYGWDMLDFLFVSGDAYVDHPSFGCALITRVLVEAGYRVGIIAQPDPDDPESLMGMGRPLLGVLVSSGVVDSMVNHYTAARKRRSDDAYSAGGQAGRRPDRAVVRYSRMVRRQLGDIPLIIGGIEASLRRFAHYDYWSDSVRPGILEESGADLLVYGEGEHTLLAVAGYLAQGVPIAKLNTLPGTAVLLQKRLLAHRTIAFLEQHAGRIELAGMRAAELAGDVLPQDDRHILLPSSRQVQQEAVAYAVAARIQLEQQDPGEGKVLIQPHPGRYLIQNPPAEPLTGTELDRIYALPFAYSEHPVYREQGGVPALAEVRFSVTAHRGCFGGCHFCAITQHMGRLIRSRSDASILAEVDHIAGLPDFKGYIHDIGGPTANFHQPACTRQRAGSVCHKRQCLFPRPCPHLEIDHRPYRDLLEKARGRPGVRKVFVRSGIRFDAVLADPDPSFLEQLCRHHISGQLKIAPEHISDPVLTAMGKPGASVYMDFCRQYRAINERLGLKQYLVPYLMSGHPGSTLHDAIALACHLRQERRQPQQVQDFYPTPGTLSTAQYHTGIDPLTMQSIHVPDQREKRLQRALLQPTLAKNRQAVLTALQQAGRTDLIGFAPTCLISPDSGSRTRRRANSDDKNRSVRTGPVRQQTRSSDKGGKHHEHHHARKRTGGQTTRQDRRRR